jgi:soluble lytic murein transglycosylase
MRSLGKHARRIWPALAATALLAVCAYVSLAAPEDATSGPLADFKIAISQLQGKQIGNGPALLRQVAPKLPQLADYIAWFLASSQFDGESYADVPGTLEPIFAQAPPSPLIWRAALLTARADVQLGNAHEAVAILRKYYDKLPQPQGDLTLATVFAADNDLRSAAAYDQRVYYGYPLTTEAAQAEADLAQLRDHLGDQYPPALGKTMLARAVKLLQLNQPVKARAELVAMLPQLTGAERDLARVKIGVADYDRKLNVPARTYLKALELPAGEADAERLHYLLLLARRLNDRPAMDEIAETMGAQYPTSHWRMESLWALASLYLTENRPEQYEPLYRACYENFASDTRASECHWKVAWLHYLRRADDAGEYLRAQLEKFPKSDEVPGALYFLGRMADAANDAEASRVYYTQIVRDFPSHYYTALARERLASSAPAARAAVARASSEEPTNQADAFLRTVAFPQTAHAPNFQPNAVAKKRIERARMLTACGLDEWAEGELRYAAQYEDQPQAISVELATQQTHRELYAQALRYVKRYSSDYLRIPMDAAPANFWKLAFPVPYRAEFERAARKHNLDLYLLTALARQESEFDPKAVSPSSARGLTQLLPTTGRELARRLQMKSVTTASLFQPGVNVELGAYYLRSIADSFDGRWEEALAGYNAGPNRVKTWLTWAEFREPAEFVETIPYRETRNYVQIVLRNADLYRRIYKPGPLTASAAAPRR